eukprot:snap_masked-scaffold273_size229271-processed-gene-1.9 protein:Tk00747 transcript:snap_masked-scaffold273_size229271-processed-gene-1.9-mRNA-1 annotation:"neuronal growth regulator 1-like"
MNQLTNTLDPRIKGIHVPGSDLWALRIQDTTLKDDGQYECQITTAQKTIEIVTLNVLDPTTNILGPDEVFLSKGSTLNLTCRITRGPNTQPFIIWTHQSKMLKYISYENEPNALSTNAQGEILTQIVVAETAVGHSGRYRCEPSNAPHAEVLVHVLDGVPKGERSATKVKKLLSSEKGLNARLEHRRASCQLPCNAHQPQLAYNGLYSRLGYSSHSLVVLFLDSFSSGGRALMVRLLRMEALVSV